MKIYDCVWKNMKNNRNKMLILTQIDDLANW